MKKKTGYRIRRIVAVLAALVMALSLAACGGGQSGGTGSASPSGGGAESSGNSGGAGGQNAAAIPAATFRDGVVRVKEADLSKEDIDTDGLQLLALEDGWFYGFNYTYSDDGASSYQLVRFQEDGSGFSKKPFEGVDEDTEISAAAFQNGSYYIVMTTYSNSPALDYELEAGQDGDSDIGELPDDLSDDAQSTHRLCSFSPDGKMGWSVEVKKPEDDSAYYIDSVAAVGDDVFVISSMGVDRYLAKDGSFGESVCSVKPEEMVGSFYVLQDGTVLMSDDAGTSVKISAYDGASGQFTEKLSMPTTLVGAMIYPGKQYDLYLVNEEGIYGAVLKDGSVSTVVNFVNSDLDLQGVSRVIEAGDGRIAVQAYGSEFILTTYILEMVDPKDVKEKTELVLGGYYIDFDVRSQVIKFNKENDKYRISIFDYSQFDLEDDDYENSTGLTRMNTDIASGNAPDIMSLSEGMPVESYISKGVFEDLTQRYDDDKEIDKSDFLQNVVDAFRTDGKMYLIVPAFTVTGVSGKTKYIGDGKDLTIEKAKKIAESQGIRPERMFGVTERSTILSSAIEFSGNQFIDMEAHSCNFNTPEFEKLLEFVKTIPTEITEDMYQDIYTQYLGDKALLSIQYLNSMYDYYYMTRDMFGDLDVTVTGFPSEKNQGPSVAGTMKLGVSSSTSEPDGCWSFVRRFLLPDYQMSVESPLPISEKAIRAQGESIIKQAQERLEAYDDYLRELNEASDDEDADSTVSEALAVNGREAGDEAGGAGNIEVTADMVENGVPDAEEGEEELQLDIDGQEVMLDDWGDDEDDDEVFSSLPEFSEKDIEKFLDVLKSLNYSVNAEQTVLNIIIEESEAYFAGQKSAAEVSDIIQSRVQVYLKENE